MNKWWLVLKVWLAATLAYYFLMEALFGGFFGDVVDAIIAIFIGAVVMAAFVLITAVEWIVRKALGRGGSQ